MRTLFLNPPSYAGFDGGAGARYQARREIRSFWYPTWLAYPAGLVRESRLIDAPPAGLSLEDAIAEARDYELVIFHTSTPSLRNDIKVAERLKAECSGILIGFVGPHTMVQPEATLRCSEAVDFVTTGEFDYAAAEVAHGRRMEAIPGICFRKDGNLVRTQPQPTIHDLDALPFVSEVYARNLRIEDYFIGYLQHPYVSLYTGRGCRSKCSFCLWPQTIGGHIYRTRSVANVCAEMKLAKRLFPQAKEFFFDDDTFTDDLPRAEEIARNLPKLGITWSCNAKANVPPGCGKSTFLSCLNRMTDLVPGCEVTGRVLLEENNILNGNTDPITLRRRVGMIFQKPNPFPLSIRKNLTFPLKQHGVRSRAARARKLETVLHQVGLWDEVKDRLDAPAFDLSGGQQQRLCLARALLLDPEVILLDEPCSALDPIASGVVEDMIVALRGRYTTVIVTHNLAQARRIADDVAMFWVSEGAGRLVEHGPVARLFESPAHDITAAYVRGGRG